MQQDANFGCACGASRLGRCNRCGSGARGCRSRAGLGCAGACQVDRLAAVAIDQICSGSLRPAGNAPRSALPRWAATWSAVMPSVAEGAREIRREYVIVPVTCAFTSAPCAISRSMIAIFGGKAGAGRGRQPSPSSAGSHARRNQERRQAHGADIRVSALVEQDSHHFHVAGNGGAHQRRASGVVKLLDETSAVPSPAGAMHIELRIEIDTRGQQGLMISMLETGGRPGACSWNGSGPVADGGDPSPEGSEHGFSSVDGDVERRCGPTSPRDWDLRRDPARVWRRRYGRYRARSSAE